VALDSRVDKMERLGPKDRVWPKIFGLKVTVRLDKNNPENNAPTLAQLENGNPTKVLRAKQYSDI